MTREQLNASYHGHVLIIEADEEPPGRWRWSYLIDGRIATVGVRAGEADARSALRQGVKAARLRVHTLDRRPA